MNNKKFFGIIAVVLVAIIAGVVLLQSEPLPATERETKLSSSFDKVSMDVKERSPIMTNKKLSDMVLHILAALLTGFAVL